jgi:beta-phosphoglucomutase-like phosphatase (HAD superfamily)
VFEDTPVGIQAARAAGMKAVGVTTTHPSSALRGADEIVQRLDELSVSQLRTWFA